MKLDRQKDHSFPAKLKLQLSKCLTRPVMLYGCEARSQEKHCVRSALTATSADADDADRQWNRKSEMRRPQTVQFSLQVFS
ncbi:hypothetical protein PoB_003631900 [Plakobranchus ocellatus]|uniref:Uncharacterized protein n=1 Tax=Plakobranchus ocellatus TaxID=259542 RepID=A0AAV4APT6_9GAST|nr:hypothetical protein PoB_003631900 [Plakobranchus ocellatus]